jgi:iron complex outermembrane receptor protein
LYDAGLYIYSKWKRKKWSISGGIRYDLRKIQWNNFYVAANPLTGFDQQSSSQNPDATLQFESYQKLFQGISGSIGATYQPNKNLSFKANIGRAYRAPNITEIGSNGLDPGAHIIYLGNRNFKPEFSFQQDFGMNLKFKDFSAEASFFNNNIENYIFMSIVADASGNPIIDAQGNKTFQYQQSAAHLYGTEFSFIVHPHKSKGFRWHNSLSMVYGFNRKSNFRGKGTEGAYLPLIPPCMLVSSVSQAIKPGSGLIILTPKFEVEYAAAQNRYLGLNSTERATPSYSLFNTGLTSEIKYADAKTLQFIFQVSNLFNRTYQSHLNRLKYFEHYTQTPNGRHGIYNMGRNFALKMIVPF